jgi:hypothetical protein
MHDEQARAAAFAEAAEAAGWHADREGLAVTFERILVSGDAAVAVFTISAGCRRMFVSLERTGSGWDALDSTVVGPDNGGWQSFRPSDTRPDHWTVVAAGVAPERARTAVIVFGRQDQAVPVVDGVYLYAVALERLPDFEPELQRLPVRFLG